MDTVKNQSGKEKIYTPPAWRLLIVYFVLPISATLLGWISRYLLDSSNGRAEKWLDGLGVFLYAVIAWGIISILLVGFNRDWFAIKIDDISISGPAPLIGRAVLLLSEIDAKKTRQRTAIDRVFKVWKIWDKKRNKVLINGYYFRDDQMTEIRQILNLDNQ